MLQNLMSQKKDGCCFRFCNAIEQISLFLSKKPTLDMANYLYLGTSSSLWHTILPPPWLSHRDSLIILGKVPWTCLDNIIDPNGRFPGNTSSGSSLHKRIAQSLYRVELVDVCRLLHSSERDYTFYSSPQKTKQKLTYRLLSNSTKSTLCGTKLLHRLHDVVRPFPGDLVLCSHRRLHVKE